jgi:hypothetical protein
MADEAHFKQLLDEFRRAGVDPDTFSAILAVSQHDALRALRALPDQAGPAAFLAELRRQGARPPATTPADGIPRVSGQHRLPKDDRTTGAA